MPSSAQHVANFDASNFDGLDTTETATEDQEHKDKSLNVAVVPKRALGLESLFVDDDAPGPSLEGLLVSDEYLQAHFFLLIKPEAAPA